MLRESTRLTYGQKIRLISRDARLTIGTWTAWAFGYGINDVLFNLYLSLRSGGAGD